MSVLLIKNIKNIAVATLVVGLLVGITPQATQAHPHERYDGNEVHFTLEQTNPSYQWVGSRGAKKVPKDGVEFDANDPSTYTLIPRMVLSLTKHYSLYYTVYVAPHIHETQTADEGCDYGRMLYKGRYEDRHRGHWLEFDDPFNTVTPNSFKVCVPIGRITSGYAITENGVSRFSLSGTDFKVLLSIFTISIDNEGRVDVGHNQSDSIATILIDCDKGDTVLGFVDDYALRHIPSFSGTC